MLPHNNTLFTVTRLHTLLVPVRVIHIIVVFFLTIYTVVLLFSVYGVIHPLANSSRDKGIIQPNVIRKLREKQDAR